MKITGTINRGGETLDVTINISETKYLWSDIIKECESWDTIEIPEEITNINEHAFSECTKLTSINVDDNNPKYSSMNGVLFNKDGTELIKYPMDRSDMDYFIPNDVAKIHDFAFHNCTNLISVTIPKNVTSIGSNAFQNCTKLRYIGIPNAVTSIDDCAFSGCTDLTYVNMGNGIKYIGEYAFDCCTSMTSIIIPDNVTCINEGAFYGCTNVEYISMPNSIEYIGTNAFIGCRTIEHIHIRAVNKEE